MDLIYHLSDQARRRLFVETGRDPGQVQALSVDPAQLSADDRRLLVEINRTMSDKAQLTLPVWTAAYTNNPHLTLEAPLSNPADLLAVYRDARMAAEAIYAEARETAIDKAVAQYAAWSDEREPSYSAFNEFAGSPRLDELKAAHAAAKAKAKELATRAVAFRERMEAQKAADKEARIAERAIWAAEYGSAHLRKCVEQGYDCQRLYVLERAKLEHPGYTVDFDDKADWRARSGPSESALDEAARVGGEVVWLTALPVDDGSPEEYQEGWEEEREAVVIRGYLGKYDLVKAL